MRDRVVVITGASSGIGRATAAAFAKEGARLVLAARRGEMLEEAAAECRQAGGDAVAVVADVGDPAQVAAIARAAEAAYGGFDVWVNNAGVLHFGELVATPLDVVERVLQVNLIGTIYGAREALLHFRARRRGVLINTGSVLGVVGQPYAAAYVASKFAVRGLGESLRQEVRDLPEVHVCTVSPGPVDTPGYQHAANYSGREVKALPLIYKPEDVAKVTLSLVRRPRREAFAGPMFGLATSIGKTVAPGLSEGVTGAAARAFEVGKSARAHNDGAVHEPARDGMTTSGGWRRRYGAPGVAWAAVGATLGLLVVGRAVISRR